MKKVDEFKGRKEGYVWVRDKEGDEYLCPVHSVKDTKNVTEAELKHCVCGDVDVGVNPHGG